MLTLEDRMCWCCHLFKHQLNSYVLLFKFYFNIFHSSDGRGDIMHYAIEKNLRAASDISLVESIHMWFYSSPSEKPSCMTQLAWKISSMESTIFGKNQISKSDETAHTHWEAWWWRVTIRACLTRIVEVTELNSSVNQKIPNFNMETSVWQLSCCSVLTA